MKQEPLQKKQIIPNQFSVFTSLVIVLSLDTKGQPHALTQMLAPLCSTVLYQAHIPRDRELDQGMVTTAPTASSLTLDEHVKFQNL